MEENEREGEEKIENKGKRKANFSAGSLTFIVGIASLILFFMFIYALPSGINVASTHSIEHEGDFRFYGAVYGDGKIEIYGENCSLKINNETVNASEIKLMGNAHYTIPYAYCNMSGARFHKIFLRGNMTVISSHYAKQGYFNGSIYGDMEARLYGEVKLRTAKNIDPYIYEEKPFLKIIPVSMDKIFIFIDGENKIDGNEINASKIYARGEGTAFYSINNENEGTEVKALSYIQFVDEKFYTTEDSFYLIPYKIIFIWIVSLAVFIASLFVKSERFREIDKKFHGTSVILGILFFAISLFLWIKQAEIIFGKEIYFVTDLSNIVAAGFFMLPYVIAVVIIGFPLKTAIVSAMSMLGMTDIGKLIGRPIGFMASFYLGIIFLPSILNMLIVPFLNVLPSMLPG